MAWLAEQSELIYSVYLFFEWMPEQFRDLCTGVVVVAFAVALSRVVLGMRAVFEIWTGAK